MTIQDVFSTIMESSLSSPLTTGVSGISWNGTCIFLIHLFISIDIYIFLVPFRFAARLDVRFTDI